MQAINIKQLGVTDYETVFSAMKTFTLTRNEHTTDELWLTQHYPVFTQGQAGKPEHILNTTDIPIVQSDRGGQITYHGQGQIVLYFLIDIKRRKIGVRQMVTLIENVIIELLASLGITAFAKPDAPGVYITDGLTDKKIASLGLRIRNGRTYHGLSLNVDMDLSPFDCINPCGYQGLKMTQVKDLLATTDSNTDKEINFTDIEQQLVDIAQRHLSNNLCN